MFVFGAAVEAYGPKDVEAELAYEAVAADPPAAVGTAGPCGVDVLFGKAAGPKPDRFVCGVV